MASLAIDTFAPARIRCAPSSDGGTLVFSEDKLRFSEQTLTAVLERRASEHPDRVFLAERRECGWATLTYADAWLKARILARALLERGASSDHPVAVLAENGIAHALVALGSMVAGVPVSPISPSYSKLSTDFGKLKYVLASLTPSILFVDSATVHSKALASIGTANFDIIAGDKKGTNSFPCLDDLLEGPVLESLPLIEQDTVAKVLFTSGSTAMPKGVIQTHRMMVVNQEAIASAWPFLMAQPPVLVDWLPWNHVFGGNQNFNMALVHGGSIYIDPGKPAQGAIEKTAESLRIVAPTVYFNVPRGFDMLIPILESDEPLGRLFFSRLQLIGYAGAALSEPLWRRLEALGERHTGRRVPMAALWGSTETAPVATMVQFDTDSPGNIGVPIPGCILKLIPNHGRLEVRVKGPCVMPGYWRSPTLTADAFDADGFYKIGDALKFADIDDPSQGLVFDGRTGENFKLSSGTWVNVGPLRTAAVGAGLDLISDVVVAGHNKDYVALLVFPNMKTCRTLAGPDTPDADVLIHPNVSEALRATLERLNNTAGGSSTRVRRAMFVSEPPSADANEITDKGYINQRAVLERRSSFVNLLFADQTNESVVSVG